MRNIALISCLGTALFLASGSPAPADARLDLVGIWDSRTGEGTEVISVQGSTARAALTNSEEGTVSILDLSDPANPTLIGTPFDLGVGKGEGVNGVAFHPTEDYFAVAIQVTGADNGRVELRSATTGTVLNTLTTGSEPDAVAIDKQGRRAVVSDEGETFKLVNGELVSAPGSVTVIDLRDGAAAATSTIIALPDATGTPGMVSGADRRFLEREVDMNGDGDIADEFEDSEGGFDENGNGVIEDRDFFVGTIDGIDVFGNEEAGERLSTRSTPPSITMSDSASPRMPPTRPRTA
jgi:WD40 repeat protein